MDAIETARPEGLAAIAYEDGVRTMLECTIGTRRLLELAQGIVEAAELADQRL